MSLGLELTQSEGQAPAGPHPGPAEDEARVRAMLCCPRCRSALAFDGPRPRCSAPACPYGQAGFPVAAGQPVLVDFETSIFDRSDYERYSGSVIARDETGDSLKTRLRRFIAGTNAVAERVAPRLLSMLKAQTRRPAILIIGGGAIGSGAGALYRDGEVLLVGTDVYASVHTRLVADGHALPFRDGSFDGVWIQAVLEHVLDPGIVAAEIHRVLKPGGLVYADTPFMQPVHEAAYDFTRFTCSGHRWLFRRFEEIESGAVGGAGTASLWSIRYLLRALGLGKTGSALVTLPLFWLRFLDRLAGRRGNVDAASGVFFFGRRSDSPLSPKAMPAYYGAQART
jgi:SAM-dependent methyltransferase